MNSNQISAFEERRKPEKYLSVKNRLNPHMTPSLVIEPGPHRWEANALAATPSLYRQEQEEYTRKQATFCKTL